MDANETDVRFCGRFDERITSLLRVSDGSSVKSSDSVTEGHALFP